MWNVIVALLYVFVTLTTALKSNLSLLESKVKRGAAFKSTYVQPRRLEFVVSIRRVNEISDKMEHVCMGCMVTKLKGVFPLECEQQGKAHYVATERDEYSNKRLKLIKHYEQPEIRRHVFLIQYFVMEEPLWKLDESPVLANFEPTFDIRDSKNITAMLWNSFAEKPYVCQQLLKLLKIPFNIAGPPQDEYDSVCTIKISDDKTFELTQGDRGGPVYLENTLIGILLDVNGKSRGDFIRMKYYELQ